MLVFFHTLNSILILGTPTAKVGIFAFNSTCAEIIITVNNRNNNFFIFFLLKNKYLEVSLRIIMQISAIKNISSSKKHYLTQINYLASRKLFPINKFYIKLEIFYLVSL